MPSNLTDPEHFKLKVIQAAMSGTKTNSQAAKLLHLSIRQVKRLKNRVTDQGETAVIHKLKHRVGNRSTDTKFKEQVIALIKSDYADFKPTLAAEKLQERHGLAVNPETLRLWMRDEGLWKVRKQRQAKYHSWRERMPYFGELEQFDGSYHFWFENRLKDERGNPREVCLLAAIDDSTGKITKLKFAFNEGVEAVFSFWKEYVIEVGKPLKIYLDKFSTYKVNHKNAVDNTELLTQFQIAMQLLNIELIPANSPQAKGRIERLFKTLQDRLVKEMRLANIQTVEAGNQFLDEIFVSQFNAKFAVLPTKEGDLHRKLSQKERSSLAHIFSTKSQRRVNNDFTIQFKNHFYQLKEIQPTTIRPKDKVTVEEHLDGTIHFEYRQKYLNFFVLPEKPKTVAQPAILTTHPLNYKPPPNHPWRQYKPKL